MSRIRGKNTKPEMVVRSALHRRGFRFRVHAKNLPGKPDLVFRKHRAVIFVHGCFLARPRLPPIQVAGHPQRFLAAEKSPRTCARDRDCRLALAGAGWRVAIVWECALKGRTRLPLNAVAQRCAAWLESDKPEMRLKGDETRTTA